MKTSKLLGIVIVLQALILVGQWTGGPSASTARADVTNPAERQIAILDELKTLNGKMDNLISTLRSGDVQVKVAKEK
ncbi:MAG TPA: hypothetical protein VN541_16160 [Tepidisphaeraceae bacterium]|nr:hypothetical protein [Tepidisphaeraceae bacterium]